jgi:hypothetical protein
MKHGACGKPTMRKIKKVGMRCVAVCSSGKWKFRKRSACSR